MFGWCVTVIVSLVLWGCFLWSDKVPGNSQLITVSWFRRVS